MQSLNHLHLDEKNHVEEPFLKQLEAMPNLPWKVLRLENGSGQMPLDSGRENFDQVVLKNELKSALKRINPWMHEAQVTEALTDIERFDTDNLSKNNNHVLDILTKGTKVAVEGKPNENVFYVDFKNPEKNSFIAISQFKIRIKGTDKHIYPDIICFLNGIPVVIIECKSPKAKEPIPDAIDQLMRYCEQRNYVKEGSKLLAYYNQFIIATCRSKAKFGTVTTSIEKHFYRWTDPYPETLEDLANYCNPQKTYFVNADGKDDEDIPLEIRTSPNDQQRLIHGMLKPKNLLNIIQSFSVWSTTDDGHLIKVVGRYQQFRAVKKTIERLFNGKNKMEKGGIIWHTQGSGKSLTMVFLIREMYLHTLLQSYKVILLTDRTQLDDQIKATAQSIGYTINDPKNISELKAVLKNNNTEIVSAMIHKFQERDFTASFPELNTSDKILILTDEAHRTQYSKLGSNLDRALPNAIRIAFTGTPITRTENTFGDYIDKYTMRQAIKDGVTLEIVYEGRTHTASIDDKENADKKFQDVFKDYKPNEQIEALIYGAKRAYLESIETIKEKAKDMLKHYVTQVLPNGYKAQVVCISKDAAHRYKLAFDEAIQKLLTDLKADNPHNLQIEKLEKLETAVVISEVDHNDKPYLKEYDEKYRKAAIAGFKLKFGKTEKGISNQSKINGNIGILIVVDMLLTGFDAPIEQVMYLDKVIVNHNLLQAIARVNRVYDENKQVGFVIDYVGMGNHLENALHAYLKKELEEITGCLLDTTALLAELQNSHKALIDYFTNKGLSEYSDPDDIYNIFYDETIRSGFTEVFSRFSKALDNIFPKKEALDYIPELNRFAEIQALAAQHFRDKKMSMKGVSEKLRSVTDAYLKSKGISTKIEPISILDEKFFENIKTKKNKKAKAAKVEHALKEIIEINCDDDPELYASFSNEILRILSEFKDNWDMIYKLLEELRKKMKTAQEENTHGLNRKTHMPIFRKLHVFIYEKKENLTDDEINNLIIWTKDIFGMLKVELSLVGFWNNPASIAKLKGEIAHYILDQCQTITNAFNNRNQIAEEILAWAKDDRMTSAIIFSED